MAIGVDVFKTYDNGQFVCWYEETITFGWSTKTYIDCDFVPNSNYPDLSNIQVNSWTGWYQDFDSFTEKWEKFLLDVFLMILLVIFVVWVMPRLVKKIFF